jgi:DNA-binding NtrC family response regulator
MKRTQISPNVSNREWPSQDESDFRPSVLVVDDELHIADSLTKILCLSGYAAVAAYDADDALETALLKPPQLLITDVMLTGMNGIDLAVTVKRIYPECGILLFSGHASTMDLLTSAQQMGHRFTLLNKPMLPKDLLAIVAENLKANGAGRSASAA